MKESMWGYVIVALGVSIVAILLLVQRLTTTNEQDYYLSREIVKSSMFDAVDYGTYMKSGKLVMSKEKFVSVFVRRFAESVAPDKEYTLEFYDIHEYPPKATVRILTNSGETTVGTYNDGNESLDVQINTFITAILETSDTGELLQVAINTDFGDVNKDNTLNQDDLNIVYKHINGQNINCSTCDITRANIAGKDNVVNWADYVVLKQALQKKSLCDLDGDGVTDGEDLTLLGKWVKDNSLIPDSGKKSMADLNSDNTVNMTDYFILETALK